MALTQLAKRWDYRRYGTAHDPVHKSHLTRIVGDFGCPKAFRYERDQHAAGEVHDPSRPVSGKAAAGTAAHETIARALTSPKLALTLLTPEPQISADAIREVFMWEYEREVAGREVAWYRDNAASVLEERITMVDGLLRRLHQHVAEVVLVEPGFIAPLGPYWLAGHIDLLYRPRSNPDTLAIADWKTGASKPSDIDLDHGWEAGVYSTAVMQGVFIPRDRLVTDHARGVWQASCFGSTAEHPSRYIAERRAMEAALTSVALSTESGGSNYPTLTYGSFPSAIHHVHLADYVPYRKAGDKEVKRPEDIAFYGLEGPQRVRYQAGQLRGPAWLPVRRTAHDMPRLASRLRDVVGMIRMGRFIDQIGEQRCRRCPHATRCLNSGYEVRGDEARELEASLRLVGEYEDGIG